MLIVGALVVGVLAGLMTLPRLFSGFDTRSESYVLLASTLYQQGESPALLRDRLVSVGIAQPSAAVLTLAQRHAGSRDKRQQHQSETLEAFGKVLLNPEATPARTEAAPPAPTAPVVAPLPTALPTLPTALPTLPIGMPTLSTPIAPRPTGAAAVTPAAGQSGAAPLAATSSSTPTAIQRGRIRPADGGSARLRKEPKTDGGTLSLIPKEAQVEVLETVRGQDIEGETRWLRVRYGNLTGYLWSKLVVVGE